GNWDSMSVGINRDTIDPSIDNIISPLSGAWFNSIPPGYSLSITEANLDDIWYTLDGGLNNYTGAMSGIINSTAWSNAGQGPITITFYVNDSAGNWDSMSVGINRDTIDPSIDNIISPSPGSNHSTPPSYSLSITEANLDEIWYTLDGGATNYTGAMSGTIDSTAWSNAGQGPVTITFYVNDSAGNWDFASVGVTKTLDLSISINSPNIAEWFRSIPVYDIYVNGNDRDSIWYTLNNGLNNYTISSNATLSSIWFGVVDSTAWGNAGQGSITITFYLNNTFGIAVSDSVQINKDTIDPSIDNIISPSSGAWFNNLPPGYSLSITEVNLDEIWYTLDGGLNNYTGAMSGTIDSTAWINAGQGPVTIIFYVNDSAGNWNSMSLGINRDTIDPSIDNIDSPSSGSSHSTPPSYSLSITEANLDEIWYTLDGGTTNYTGDMSGTIDSTAWSNAGQGAVTIIFYVKDSAGNWDSVSVGINKDTSAPPSQPSEFPLWIIFVIIGAAIGGVVGFVVLKKSKSKKVIPAQISEKKPVPKPKLEIHEELKLLDYEALKDKNRGELNAREKKVLAYIKYLEENKDYTKAAEFIGELIIIEEILANPIKVKSYRQKQIDVAITGLDYLKDQYEIESKNAAKSGDYSKALELYNESKLISENLKIYVECQESSTIEEDAILETKEPQMLMIEVEIVYSCINDLLTKYFDEIGIKYYSNPQIYDNVQNQIHGLILTDNKKLIADMDPSIRDKIKSIHIIYTEDISNENVIKLCKNFQNPYVVLIIVGIKWPENIEIQTIDIPPNKGIKHQENIRIIHYELFSTLIGLKGTYEGAFNEIIDLYNKSELDILREIHESSEIIIHSTDELLYDLKEKGLIKRKLKEYFHR
ncbi:MAG: hypothetical protein ACFE75_04945, partial [Candidatus Hodarchaeota archaeon]